MKKTPSGKRKTPLQIAHELHQERVRMQKAKPFEDVTIMFESGKQNDDNQDTTGKGYTKQTKKFRRKDAINALKELNIDIKKQNYTLNDVLIGMNIELEHKKITHGDPVKTAQIAIDHLNEDKMYYIKLLLFIE